jgi:hypothetical protein
MRSDSRYQLSFVVQFAQETDPSVGRLEGRVEHVATGQSTQFRAADELLAFLVRILTMEKSPN